MPLSAPFLRRLSLLGALAFSAILTGCGIGTIATSSSTAALNMTGQVHGGSQPVSGATIQLFAVGTGGNGTAATSLLVNPVMTDGNSYFSLTGDYTCPNADAQVYLVARGGNPGFARPVNNGALVLLSALGRCGDLVGNPNRFIWVNEVSTVAAAYTLAPFMTSYDHVAGSATNTVGVRNAFLNAQLLANTSNGQIAALPANLSVEKDKLLALADAIAPCVNSDGGTPCTALFAAARPSGGAAPTDTVGALLDIVKNPGSNVAAVFNLIPPVQPYPTALSAAPHDWTMSLTVTGGGLDSPTGLGVDKFGNVWASNYGDPGQAGLVAFSPQGTAFPGSPFGVGVQTEAYNMAVDKHGDVWVLSKEGHNTAGGTGSVAKFLGASSSTPGALAGVFFDRTLNYPQAIATDANGNGTVIIGNYNYGTATIYDLSGNYLNNLGSGVSVFPIGVTSDDAGGVWFADQGYNTVTHAFANGSVQQITCCNGAQTVALDRHGNVWATNYYSVGGMYSFSEIAPGGAVLIHEQSTGNLHSPGGAAVDAAGQFWIASFTGNVITEIAGADNAAAPGTALSPTGYGQDANLYQPFSLAIDPSGNVWVTNQAGNRLTMFFGLATPTAAQAAPVPTAP